MKLGAMRHRITISQPPGKTSSVNSLGEPTGSSTVIATVWASVETKGGNKVYREAQVQPNVLMIFTIRYRSDVEAIGAELWVSYKGLTYNCYHVENPEGRNERLLLYAARHQ